MFTRNPTRIASAGQLADFNAVSDVLRAAALEAHLSHGQDSDFEHAVKIGVSDGSDKQIRWNTGEEAAVVAQRFLDENKLSSDQLPPLTDFVKEAMLTSGGSKIKTSAKYDHSYPVEVTVAVAPHSGSCGVVPNVACARGRAVPSFNLLG